MDRAEATGLGVALAGHALLLAVLSVGFAASTREPILTQPMEVAFVEEVGLESTSPAPASEAPAARLAEVEGPVEPEAPPPPAPEPIPVPQPPAPVPVPKAAPRPQPTPMKAAPAQPRAAAKPAPPKAAPKAPPARTKTAAMSAARPTGRLKGLLNGIGDSDSNSRSTTPPAAAVGPAVRASLAGEVRRQLKPHWKAPTGADVELLRTELSIRLSRDGSVTDVDVLRTTGQNASNRPQVKLHQEQAVRAVRLASPFRLPAEYYDTWKFMSPIGFDKRLSQ
jgi:outer membrane biosynthesis protein TonB